MAYKIKPKTLTTEYLHVFIEYPGEVAGASYDFYVEDGRVRITDAGGFRIIYLKSIIKLLKKARKADPALVQPEEFDWITDDVASEDVPTLAVNLFDDGVPQEYTASPKPLRFVYSRTGDAISIFITSYMALNFRTWELTPFLETLKIIHKSLELPK